MLTGSRWDEGPWPVHSSAGWSLWAGRKVVSGSAHEIRKALRRTRGFAFVGAPGSPVLRPAPLVGELPADLKGMLDRRVRLSGWLFATLSVVGSLVSAAAGFLPFVPYLLVNALLGLVLIRDAQMHLSVPAQAAQRVSFLLWMRGSPCGRRNFRACLASVSLLIGVHYAAVVSEAGLMGWHQRAGGVHAEIAGGEIWRLATAPWLHFGWEHLFTNCALLLCLGPVALGLHRRAAATTFLLAATGGVAAQVVVLASLPGVTGGSSAGITGLAGLVWALGHLRVVTVPAGLPALAALLGFTIMVVPLTLQVRSAALAHFAGWLVGVACAGYIAVRNGGGRGAHP